MHISQKITDKELYPYQEQSIHRIFDKLEEMEEGKNLLFQLPTGGGKTFIFSEIARKYILDYKKKVLVLTHRIELCVQTSDVLTEVGVKNKVINSKIRKVEDQDQYACFVAMIETLNNRLISDDINLENVGLVIVDEAHYNAFRKIFKFFEKSTILGVTATPLSSNKRLPLNENYDALIIGESISDLIENQYLSSAETYTYHVNIDSLRVGINGDYTVSSSERLYSQNYMLDRVVKAYRDVAAGSKTLIFNSGILTSQMVYEIFKEHKLPVRHLDSTHGEKDRQETLEWFRDTKDAILTSVGILTTGFDEPTVETILLNRATRSLTLYHQMIGRGSRILPNKKKFNIIDLGNNALRLGLWQDYIDWQMVFKYPDRFIDEKENEQEKRMLEIDYCLSSDVRERFLKTEDLLSFSIKEEYDYFMKKGQKPKQVIEASIENHYQIISKNAIDYIEALDLLKLVEEEIEYRIKQYSFCLSNATENYQKWLFDDYIRKLKNKLRLNMEYNVE